MDLRELNPDEDTVLLGFLDEIISADGEYSASEKQHFAGLETALSPERVATAIAEVNRKFPNRALLEGAAKEVTRPEARQAILGFLQKVAKSDDLSGNEDEALRWLAKAWKLE